MAVTRIKSQDIGDGQVQTTDLANDVVDGDKLGITTTKGDLIVHDGAAGKPLRLPVGADGKVLVASAAASAGVEWATGVTAGSFIFGEAPSGAIDGANAAFTLANAPIAGSVRVYKNGLRQNPGAGNDYTIAGATITFLAGNIPQAGDVLLVDYHR